MMVFAALLAVLTLAHLDPEHAQLHAQHNDWLERQRAIDGMKCCDQGDVEVLVDVRWRIRGAGFQVLVDGTWVDVPPGRVLRPNFLDPNPYGVALLFRPRHGGMMYCFAPAYLY